MIESNGQKEEEEEEVSATASGIRAVCLLSSDMEYLFTILYIHATWPSPKLASRIPGNA